MTLTNLERVDEVSNEDESAGMADEAGRVARQLVSQLVDLLGWQADVLVKATPGIGAQRT